MDVFLRSRNRRKTRLCLLLATALLPAAIAQNATDDATAFKAALQQSTPSDRASALQHFLTAYPGSGLHERATKLLLQQYLDDLPEQTGAIHQLATAQVQAASPGLERWLAEAQMADQLADAGLHGADLPDAVVWASDAVQALTEPAYRRQMTLMQARYKLPPLRPHQLHEQYAHERAQCLNALANVRLHEAATGQAVPLLRDALALDPLSAETNRLQAELVLAQGDKPKALQTFMRANALAPLPPQSRQAELQLFASLEHGTETTLDERIDALYRGLYPAPFTLPKRQLDPGGHPALLELFTGSDCLPCTGPDIAVDSLLHSYPPSGLIALEFDEHIPQPDPLATPATIDRATFYTVEATPTAFLDGAPVQLLGSSRADVENLVVSLADQLEAEASLASGIHLDLEAHHGADDQVSAVLSIWLAPSGSSASPTTGDTSLRALQRARLYVALVQDNVRYPGKNGVRFHRMVVRAVHEFPAASALAASNARMSTGFDLAKIEQQNAAYLADFERNNDRFGPFHFGATATAIDPGQLHVVAWVQDPASHKVLNAIAAPVLMTATAP